MDRENAFKYDNRPRALKYIMDKLAQIDDGKFVDLDFISTEDVGKFCKLFGFSDNWAGKTIEDICGEGSKFGPPVVGSDDAAIILDILKKMVKDGQFREKGGSRFDKMLLNDFLPKSRAGFEGAPTLGHFWEFQYALQVELEHGRTHGTDVTNNHPLLTSLIVMAHLTEDSLYYARLWVMETEGELSKDVLSGKKKKDEIADTAKELIRAKCYLAKRLAEKAQGGMELPE
jgi:hypothetical protein